MSDDQREISMLGHDHFIFFGDETYGFDFVLLSALLAIETETITRYITSGVSSKSRTYLLAFEHKERIRCA